MGLHGEFLFLYQVLINNIKAKKPALLNKDGHVLAIVAVEEKFELDLENFAQKCFGTTEDKHPGVAAIKRGGNKFIAGPLEMVNRPVRHDEIDGKYFLDPLRNKSWRV